MVIQSPYPDLKIPEQDILTYLFASEDSLPESPLWINAASPDTYLSLHSGLQWIKRLALGLDHLGVEKGNVLMIVSPNHIFVPVAYLGAVGSGRIFSGANPLYTADELSFQIRNTGARVLLVHPTLLDTARKASKAAGLSKDSLYLFSDAEHKPMDGIQDWRSMLGSPRDASRYNWPRLSSSESKKQIATVNYSSGTTGLPKGVMITHYNLIANAEQTIFLKNVEKPEFKRTGKYPAVDERWINFLPLYHAYGQLNTMLMAAKLNIPVYIMSTFVFEEMLQVVQTHKITELQVAPPILVLMSKHPKTANYDLSSVAKIFSGAAPLSQSLQNECTQRFKTSIGQGWGMTEVTCAGLIAPAGSGDNIGSVGTLLPNCEIKLIDENGKEVGMGERGEIYIKGPNVSSGYWKNENATRETMLEGGWLRTGDVAVNDERGWFYIVDRLKELIKVSGLQVAPAELEAVLLTHPAVADAGVVGVQDSFDAQEHPRAYVLLKSKGAASSEEIQEWIKSKVAKHKYLTGGVVFVDEVPKSAAGKIQRKIMREWAKKDGQQGRTKL
ncbi:MAG: hypothetical protein ALECFALPRED_005773 [Alectoria fallacina]|uniref:4-coumarate--CoA ligase n=1 Tax=Alectoria fallacina TaxID=1903189 RepID=A0A8H3G072_9LECA|nr:MAG: hypothetical protein ALECFALPRED_005773 [Alectoria fallacina]